RLDLFSGSRFTKHCKRGVAGCSSNELRTDGGAVSNRMSAETVIFQLGDHSCSGEKGRATAYRVRNLYATIRTTMLAKMSRAWRDFRVAGVIEGRAADRAGLSLGAPPFTVGLRACGSGAAPTPPISL